MTLLQQDMWKVTKHKTSEKTKEIKLCKKMRCLQETVFLQCIRSCYWVMDRL